LLQPDAIPLAQRLLDGGYTVLIETSGERSLADLPREVIKIVDVKCPDSGEADTFQMKNLDAMDHKDEIKFVISTRRDYEFARDFTHRQGLAQRVHQVVFSPVHADPEETWPGMSSETSPNGFWLTACPCGSVYNCINSSGIRPLAAYRLRSPEPHPTEESKSSHRDEQATQSGRFVERRDGLLRHGGHCAANA